jgi:holo-[acyl-carrier protein] synthase
MRILHGIDVASRERVGELRRRHEAFLAEVFTAGERGYCLAQADPDAHLAGRFAAKEACLKALGLGLAGPGGQAALGSVELVRRPSGRPELVLSGWVRAQARRRRVSQSVVSLSHTGDVAVASVILVADEAREAEV